MPRACPVECSRLKLYSCERETSTGQARGIQTRFFSWCVAAIVRTPRDKPLASSSRWHLQAVGISWETEANLAVLVTVLTWVQLKSSQ